MKKSPNWEIVFNLLPLETPLEDVIKRLNSDVDLDAATSSKKHQLKKKGVSVMQRNQNILKVENGWWIAVKKPIEQTVKP